MAVDFQLRPRPRGFVRLPLPWSQTLAEGLICRPTTVPHSGAGLAHLLSMCKAVPMCSPLHCSLRITSQKQRLLGECFHELWCNHLAQSAPHIMGKKTNNDLRKYS